MSGPTRLYRSFTYVRLLWGRLASSSSLLASGGHCDLFLNIRLGFREEVMVDAMASIEEVKPLPLSRR